MPKQPKIKETTFVSIVDLPDSVTIDILGPLRKHDAGDAFILGIMD